MGISQGGSCNNRFHDTNIEVAKKALAKAQERKGYEW